MHTLQGGRTINLARPVRPSLRKNSLSRLKADLEYVVNEQSGSALGRRKGSPTRLKTFMLAGTSVSDEVQLASVKRTL